MHVNTDLRGLRKNTEAVQIAISVFAIVIGLLFCVLGRKIMRLVIALQCANITAIMVLFFFEFIAQHAHWYSAPFTIICCFICALITGLICYSWCAIKCAFGLLGACVAVFLTITILRSAWIAVEENDSESVFIRDYNYILFHVLLLQLWLV